MLQDFKLEMLVEPLLNWFIGHARVLPWREEPTPYRVWVSEIMLQQTRVEAVKPYFERFMNALPTVEALAKCPEDELLKLWEGLGYYNRVRNMQKAAIQVVEEHGGVLPADYEKLLGLKGIGHYTAGAVASIAYGILVPAVDGNVLRVITRVTADDTDIMKQSFRNEMEKALQVLMNGENLSSQSGKTSGGETMEPQSERTEREPGSGQAFPQIMAAEPLKKIVRDGNLAGAFNQALMELGATVCLPNGAPLCNECPWQELCLAKREERTGELPVKSKAKARKIEARTVLILRDGDKVAIRKRPTKGLLAGLYELPNIEGSLTDDEVISLVKQMRLAPIRIQKLAEAKHIFSHIEWHMSGYAILLEEEGLAGGREPGTDVAKGLSAEEPDGLTVGREDAKQKAKMQEATRENLIFVDAEDASARYAIPSAFAAYAKYMNIKLGNERFEDQA